MADAEPVFIVGCPRSGTSLLRDLLRSHPRLAFPPESHFIPAFYAGYGDPRSAGEARRLAARILRLEWIKAWGLDLKADDFVEDTTFAAIVRRLYGAWAARERKPRWGDKTPQYLGEMPALQRLFPSARFIHIYRDGRDVALSWLETAYEPQNLMAAATAWTTRVRAGRRLGASLLPGSYHEVRYESLLPDPRATLEAACAFVREPFSEDVLRPSSPPTRGWLDGKVRTPGATLRQGNTGKWRAGMTRAERALFESVAGGLLAELGYETEGLACRVSRLQALAWRAHDLGLRQWSRLRSPRRFEIGRSLLAIQRARLRAALRAGYTEIVTGRPGSSRFP